MQWHNVKHKLPDKGQRVIAIYKGVYRHRIVTFWIDAGNAWHFGTPEELDGKGSQPATHWHELPEMP